MSAKALGSFETSLCVTDTNHLGHVHTSQAKFSHPVSVRLGSAPPPPLRRHHHPHPNPYPHPIPPKTTAAFDGRQKGKYGKTEQEKYFQKGKFWEKRGTESRKQAV